MLFQMRCEGPPGPVAHHTLYARGIYQLRASASISDFQFLCYDSNAVQYLYMYAAGGISGSVSMSNYSG